MNGKKLTDYKYFVFRKMQGFGCDYTIGCGMTLTPLDAVNQEAAVAEAREYLKPEEPESPFSGPFQFEDTVMEQCFVVRIVENLKPFCDELMDAAEIAKRLSYSERTIKNVIHDITARLQLRNRSQAVAYAMREGLL